MTMMSAFNIFLYVLAIGVIGGALYYRQANIRRYFAANPSRIIGFASFGFIAFWMVCCGGPGVLEYSLRPDIMITAVTKGLSPAEVDASLPEIRADADTRAAATHSPLDRVAAAGLWYIEPMAKLVAFFSLMMVACRVFRRPDKPSGTP